MAAHKHAELIKAWADGAEIQSRLDGYDWKDSPEPIWDSETEYRRKPISAYLPVYPESKMTEKEMLAAYAPIYRNLQDSLYRAVANAALRHACDNGQIVTREEFDRAVGDRKARDMAVALAVMLACHDCVNSQSNHALRISKLNLADIVNTVK